MHTLEYSLFKLSEILNSSLEKEDLNRELITEVSDILMCLASASHYEYIPDGEPFPMGSKNKTGTSSTRKVLDRILIMARDFKTIPATEENITLEVDTSQTIAGTTDFGELSSTYMPISGSTDLNIMSPPHAVLVDDIKGLAGIDYYGSYSLRLQITLEEAHPDLGTSFTTKYFRFPTPGVVEWGHEMKSFKLEKIV